jgi:hypothetical protein
MPGRPWTTLGQFCRLSLNNPARVPMVEGGTADVVSLLDRVSQILMFGNLCLQIMCAFCFLVVLSLSRRLGTLLSMSLRWLLPKLMCQPETCSGATSGT